MLTPQEVSNRAFPKAMVGGYNMAMVDEFLDELTDDYTALYKENAALKAKLKVLVDKVEEYRATEESMRAALLTAQKMANTIVEDAEKQKAEMLDAAKKLVENGYELYATGGTSKYLDDNGVRNVRVYWPSEEGKEPQALTLLHEMKIDMVVNIPKDLTPRELTDG